MNQETYDKKAIEIARREYVTDEVEIDGHPAMSHADDGAWVAAWVWVSDVEIAA